MAPDEPASVKLRPRIAVVHPVPLWHGGAEVVALWTVEALKQECQVTILSYGEPPDFDELNRRFGTSIRLDEIAWLRIPIPALAFRFRPPFDILWRYVTMLYCRHSSQRFDLSVSTFYEMDFGRPGVQYCHCPMYATPPPSSLRGCRQRSLRARAFATYRRLAGVFTGFRRERMLQNVTLSNSDWTGRALAEAYGVSVRTIYPPVQGSLGTLLWSERADGFVCIGRLVPEKRFDVVIRILERVRQQGEDVHLHLVLSAPDPECKRLIEALAAQRASWVHVEWNLSREGLMHLVGTHKYGIHARQGEHFGLAPAELAVSGAIVFVHDSGGQVEIASDPRLRYASEEDAVAKILCVLRDAALQGELRSLLAQQAAAFSAQRFMAEMRAVVLGCLSRDSISPPPRPAAPSL